MRKLSLIKREPARLFHFAGYVVTALVIFGVLGADKGDAIKAILGAVPILLSGEATRRKVRPEAKARLDVTDAAARTAAALTEPEAGPGGTVTPEGRAVVTDVVADVLETTTDTAADLVGGTLKSVGGVAGYVLRGGH